MSAVVDAASVARYTVEHETSYTYRVAVSQSWQLAHLTPLELPWQKVLKHELAIEPPPDERHERHDAFGNRVTHFGIHGPHPLLGVRMICDVEVGDRADPRAAPELAWEAVRDALHDEPAQDALRPARLAEPSALVGWSDAAHAYAASTFTPDRDWLDAVTELMQRIHREFDFEPGTTTVTTSVDEVLAQKSGVCQDFAHVMIACLRSHGLPARYVSGYLLTQPPPGQARLLGADVSHAWVAAYSPRHGWVELDPTNDQLADRRYITLATGADFADVVPLRGIILGGRGQKMRVAVSVIPR
jgi:transglutaminase-like putative cysteine protease